VTELSEMTGDVLQKPWQAPGVSDVSNSQHVHGGKESRSSWKIQAQEVRLCALVASDSFCGMAAVAL